MPNNTTSAELCLTDRQMMLAVNVIERIFIGTVVPVLILFGISGNILNLTVLMAPNMRTRSNQLLACLAVADIVFLVCMLPHSLAHYSLFSTTFWFRLLYLGNKMHLLAILNWASAAAIWLILVICLERLMGIKYPLSVRKHKKLLTPMVVVSFVVVMTGILTAYYHFSYICVTKYFCNGTQFHAMCLRVDSEWWFRNTKNPNSDFVKAIAWYGPRVNAILVIFAPILLVAVSNVMLIFTLRKRQKLFIPAQKSVKGESQFSGSQARTEHKVTITVTAIVTSFTITQGPSAFVTVMSFNYSDQDWQVALTAVVTTLVVLGKALNFVLFCLSSRTFRQRLFSQTKQGILRKSTRTISTMTGSTLLESAASVIDKRRSRSVAIEMSRVETRGSKQRALSSQSMLERQPLREFRRGMSFL
ncbi:unnamed protein product [Caenorhabditis auriculariae]|uniref:G-protein coupled receptors family 1 profile domain-containing protein n=1 Tax=Caenorhabditis auriculariae TaxID=2777116 RepID=A0A8S1GWI4_9PELO|nr:unnamed protein product [Caenorhabditis auriculariae]